MKIMKGILWVILALLPASFFSQTVKSDNEDVEEAYKLAVNTVNINIRRGILAAGGDYGGEWTRDIAINTWNGVSLTNPDVAEKSLWSVTINKDTIGHQYWDKILWVVAARNHYLVTGDKAFLKQAYVCSVNTMKELETIAFDPVYGMFTGPSVFNDGIAGFPEPIFEPENNSSYVLDHKNAFHIKCLSTNSVYYGAYKALAEMGTELKAAKSDIQGFKAKGEALRNSILKHLYDEKQGKLNYLVDHEGTVDPSQEGLGLAYAIIFGVLNQEQALKVTKQAQVSKFGITSVYPDFPRYSPEKPGRHNNILWPMVNGFYAQATIVAGNKEAFEKELNGLIFLALHGERGKFQFWEIYNPYTGYPDGGWQSNRTWKSCHNQTWSATAYMNMVLYGLAGMRFGVDGLSFSPYLPQNVKDLKLEDFKYRQANLNIAISGNGSKIKSFSVNGKKKTEYKISDKVKGKINIRIELE